MIDPQEIPEFTGDLDALATDAKALRTDAGHIRGTGEKVDSTFQGLSAYYHAPEAEQLFATTQPVRTRADDFAGKLEKVTAALDTYGAEVRPIVARLDRLRADAAAFVAECGHGDGWKYDGGKVKRNNALMQDVAAATAAFWDAERRAANAITALVGGTHWTTDDGSHAPGMYGYRADDLEHAQKTPWGSQDSQKHHIYDVGHWVKAFVYDGFVIDGVWGTLKGLGTLSGFGGWDAFKQSWTNLGHLAVGLSVPALLGPAGLPILLATPDKALPGFLKDGKHAVINTGKSLVAWDEWGKNPGRAAGAVTFNILTAIGTEGAGEASKAGTVAKAISIAGKGGRLVDPMTYVLKGAGLGLTKLKVGDLLDSLKNMHAGSSIQLPDGSLKMPDETLLHPDGSVALPDGSVLHPDGTLVGPDGAVVDHPAPSELSAADRKALAGLDHDLHDVHDPSLVHAGADPPVHAGGQPAHVRAATRDLGPRAAHDPPSGGGTGPHDPGTPPTHQPPPSHPDPGAPPAHPPASGHPGGGGGGHPGGGDAGHPGPVHADDPVDPHASDPGHEPGNGDPADPAPSRTPAEIAHDHVRLANTDPAWRAAHYDTLGRRLNVDQLVDGQHLPQLTDAPGGGWMNAHDLPFADRERYLGDPVNLGRDTVRPADLHHLDEVSAHRAASVELTNAERLHDAHPTAATAHDLALAHQHFLDTVGHGVANNSKLSEALGEEAARRHVMQQMFPGSHEITDLPQTANGSRRFDQIWRTKDGHLVIVEAKAPSGRLDWRRGNGEMDSQHMVKQGTIEYVRTIVADMDERAIESPGDGKYAAELKRAIRTKSLQYVKVQAVDNAGRYLGADLTHFKIF